MLQQFKKQRFSIRKLSVGVVSLAVASIFMGVPSNSVSAQTAHTQQAQHVPVKYINVDYQQLSAEEQLVVKKEAISTLTAQADNTYILVYEKVKQDTLPKTGSSDALAMLLGASAIFVAYKLTKHKKKQLLAILVMTSVGFSSMTTTMDVLAKHVIIDIHDYQLTVGSRLLDRTIATYHYVGYIPKEAIGKESPLFALLPQKSSLIQPMKTNKLPSDELATETSSQSVVTTSHTATVTTTQRVTQKLSQQSSQQTTKRSTTVTSTSEQLTTTESVSQSSTVQPETSTSTRLVPTSTTKNDESSVETSLQESTTIATETSSKTIVPSSTTETTTTSQATTVSVETSTETSTTVADVIETRVETVVRAVPFETEEIDLDTLFVGTTQETPGVPGSQTVEITTVYKNGKAQPNPTEKIIATTPAINRVIRRGTKEKIVPVIKITQFDEKAVVDPLTTLVDKPLTKTVNVGYSLEKTDNVSQQTYELLKDGKVVQSGSLTTPLTLTNLEHDVKYTLVIKATYNIGDGDQVVSDSKDFILELKKIEIKDVREYRLFKKEGERHVRMNSLPEVPADVTNYFAEVISDNYKTMVLPVKTIVPDGEAFKITLQTEDLVEKRHNTYEHHHDFTYPKTKQSAVSSSVKSFADLIARLNEKKDDASAVIDLGADVSATEQASNTNATYVSGHFKGRFNGNGYTVSDMTLPLFDVLNGATVENVNLKDANIVSPYANAGILAMKMENNATATNVSVSGHVSGMNNVGGVVGSAENARLTNIQVKADVKRTQNMPDHYLRTHTTKQFGGVVGWANKNIHIDKAHVDVNVQSNYGAKSATTAGIVGKIENRTNGTISNVSLHGKLDPLEAVGHTGAIVGEAWYTFVKFNNIISSMDATDGNILYGNTSDWDGRKGNFTNVFVVSDKAKGNEQTHTTISTITSDQITAKEAEFGITAPAAVPYAHKEQYNGSLVHHNVEKFIPFYNVSQINKYAAILNAKTPYTTKKVIGLLPMNNNAVVSHFTNETLLTHVLVHFEDGSTQKHNLRYREQFNSLIKEYDVTDLGIIYTPEAFINHTNSVSDLVAAFNSVNTDNYKSIDLEDQIVLVKQNLETVVRNLLSSDKVFNGSSSAVSSHIVEKIKANKEHILLGLTYLSRWYGIQFNDINLGDIMTYQQRFFGNNANTIDTLIYLGQLAQPIKISSNDATGLNQLKMRFNPFVFKQALAQNVNEIDLFTFLNTLKNKFTSFNTMEDWFKATTTAYIVESSIGNNNELDPTNKTYERFSKKRSELNPYILPLLTAKDGIYMIVSPAAISMGMAEVYVDPTLKETNPAKYEEQLTSFKANVARQAEHYRRHYTFWYNMIDEKSKKALERDQLSVDTYSVRGQWRNMDSKTQAMKDFFSPMALLVGNNGSSAYANGSRVHFVTEKQLNDYGSAIYSHEIVHNNDGSVYFNGNGRRNNTGAEYFATGMFQVPHEADWNALGLNTMYDFTHAKSNPKRTQAIHANRLDTPEKLHQFMKRSFDVLYTLDYAEAEVMLAKTQEEKQKWYNTIETIGAGKPNAHKTNSLNIRRALSADVTLNTIEDLVNKEIVSKRAYAEGDKDIFGTGGTNRYYYIRPFEPIYATGENKEGAAGDIMFRRMAFELLAYKGYTNGMLPYISNVLHKEKPASAKNVTDDFVIQKVSENNYQTMAEFKIAMFKERYNKREKLKPITITFEKQTITFNTYADIKSKLEETLASDLANDKSYRTKELKNLIYTAYLNLTDDFTDDIYNP